MNAVEAGFYLPSLYHKKMLYPVLGLVLGLLLVGAGPAEVKPSLKQLLTDGNRLAQERDYKAAVNIYKRAWEIYHSSAAAYNLAVLYQHELGFDTKALYYYEQFLSLEPDAAEAQQAQKWIDAIRQQIVARQNGQPVSEKKTSVSLTKLMEPVGDEFCRQGKDYLVKGEYEAAIGAYRKAMLVNQSAAAAYNLALLYDFDLNYKAKAIYYYQRFLGMNDQSAGTAWVISRTEQIKQELLQDQGILFKEKPYKLRTP